MDTERIIGIDFGTSTSVVRVKRYQDGKPAGDGGRLDTKELIFGGLYQTVPTLIQKIGDNTKYGYDAAQLSKKAIIYQNFKVDLESDNPAKKQLARDLTEEFLHYLATVYREQSDGGHLGEAEDKERTLISYPVKWSDETKSFMLEAARKAGFPNVEGMDEAQAAIHAVTLQSEDFLKNKGYLTNGKSSTILLIDMGAGTTDLVLCRYTPGPNPINEILCTWPKSGQILFGGQEADEVLRKYIRSILPKEDANEVMKRLDRKKSTYKTWKETVVSPALSRNETVEEFSELDYLVDDLEIDMDEYDLNRAGFETFAKDYLLEFPQLVRGCLKEAHISPDEVDLAILTGGHSQWYFASEMLRGGLPQICEVLLPKMKAEPGRIISVTRPQETVALGLVYSPMSEELKEETPVHKKKDERSIAQDNTDGKTVKNESKFQNEQEEKKTNIEFYREELDSLTAIGADQQLVIIAKHGMIRIGRIDEASCLVKNNLTMGKAANSIVSRNGAFRFIRNSYSIYIKENGTLESLNYVPSGIANWYDLKDAVMARGRGLFDFYVGLKRDGTVVASGRNKYGECNVSDWRNAVAISCGSAHTVVLKEDGTVMATGDNNYGQCNVESWRNVKFIACDNERTYGLCNNGTMLATGKNENNILGDIISWSNISEIKACPGTVVGLCKDGKVVVAGVHSIHGKDPWNIHNWENIISISVKGGHLLGLKSDGTVVAAGNNKYGECNVSGWRNIVAIASLGGHGHSVGIKEDGRVVYTTYKFDNTGWGWKAKEYYGQQESEIKIFR